MTKTMISARVEEKLSDELSTLAESMRRPKAFLINEALEDYVKRQTWLKERIEAAVKAADESDTYVSHDDMMAWMKSWGKTDELPLPPLRKRSELK
jgi:predicted transcriptional regulator